MSYSGYNPGNNSGQNTARSAPPIPDAVAYPYQPPQQSQQPNYGQQATYSKQPNCAFNYGKKHNHHPTSFPPGTHPGVIRSFRMMDLDRSGFIDVKELQQALSSDYQKFSIRTIRLLMFQFRNPNDPFRTGPKEFAELWHCLGQWRGIFERFDRDRSGMINLSELRDALYSLGYAIPPSVLQLLISKYDDQGGRRGGLSFDIFVECGMIVKGLTDKFKEKDSRYTGAATLSYETFMTMVIPFLAAD